QSPEVLDRDIERLRSNCCCVSAWKRRIAAIAMSEIACGRAVGELGRCREKIQEYKIIFNCLIVHIIGAETEIQWALKVGFQTKLLIKLPCPLLRQILSDHLRRTSHLRIA